MRVVLVVEDSLSEAVVRRVLSETTVTHVVDRVFITRGFGAIKKNVGRYRSACKVLPHIVLTDLDNAACAGALLAAWSALDLPRELLFRVAVREVEAWLLADDRGISTFLGVPASKVPRFPDNESDPKASLISLARRGARKRRCAGLIPSGQQRIGALYNEHLISFVESEWNLVVAQGQSPSLERMVRRTREFLLREIV